MGPITPISHALVDWLLRTSWQVALVVAAVLVVQWLFDRRLSARWRYALWGLVVLRLAMPALPGSRMSLLNLLPDERRVAPVHRPVVMPLQYVVVRDMADLPPVVDVPQPPAPPAGMQWDWRLFVAIAWLAGVLLVAAVMSRSHLRLARRIARSTGAADAGMIELLARCKGQMKITRAVELVITNAVGGPALMSPWRPKLLLPAGLARKLGRDELRFIFLHELAHLKRWDLLLDWVLAMLRAIHWFNPAVWLAMARLRADRELARDAMVLATIGPQEQPRYGQTILDLVEHFARPAAGLGTIGMTDGMGQLRRRMRQIACFTPGTKGGAVLAMVLMLIVSGATLTEKQTPASDLGQPQVASNADAVGASSQSARDKKNADTAALLDKRLPDVNIESVPLTEAIDRLRNATEAPIDVNWHTLQEAGVKRDVPVTARLRDVKLSTALKRILADAGGGQVKLGYAVEDGVITVSTASDLVKSTETRIYDIRDLLAQMLDSQKQQAVDQLISLLKDTIDRSSWQENGGPGTIRHIAGQLVIAQTPENHRQVASLLEMLRLTQGITVELDMRLITAPQGFMEQLKKQPGGKWDLQPKAQLTPWVPSERAPLADGLVLDDDHVQKLLQAVQGEKKASVLSAPRLIVHNGQEGVISVGNERAYVSDFKPVKAADGSVTYDRQTQKAFSGIRIAAQPTISADRKWVVVLLHSEISELKDLADAPFPDAPAGTKLMVQKPVLDVVEAKALASIPNQGTLLLSGFRHREGGAAANQELLMLVKPTIKEPPPGLPNAPSATPTGN